MVIPVTYLKNRKIRSEEPTILFYSYYFKDPTTYLKNGVKLRCVHRQKSGLGKLLSIHLIHSEALLYAGRQCYRHLITKY